MDNDIKKDKETNIEQTGVEKKNRMALVDGLFSFKYGFIFKYCGSHYRL